MKTGIKVTGGKYHQARKKKLYELPGQDRATELGERKTRILGTIGGNEKIVLLKGKLVNVTDKSGKTKKLEIKNVLETPQDKFLARQNRLLKGALIDTELGKAKITNRPTQEGQINAVLISKKD